MRIAFVDIQGFIINGSFCPKELTIQIGYKQSHFLFTPPMPFSNLNKADQKTAKYLERYVHGIKYSSGDIEYSELDSILETNLQFAADYIYVRGNQKVNFLEEKFDSEDSPVIIDVVKFSGTPLSAEKFTNQQNSCISHNIPRFKCTKKNVECLQRWFKHLLPM